LIALKFLFRSTKSEASRKVKQIERPLHQFPTLDRIQDLKDRSGQQAEFANLSYPMFSTGMSNRLLVTSNGWKSHLSGRNILSLKALRRRIRLIKKP